MIDRMLHDTVAAGPQDTAVVCGRRRMTYGELGRRVAGFRDRLRDLGAQRGDHVLIVLPNLPEFVVAYFATAGVGATVQAVDPDSTDHELIGHKPSIVVTTPNRIARLRSLFESAAVVEVGDAEAEFTIEEPGNGPWVVALSSGSTGEPKRVVRTQANQFAEATNIAETAAIGREDVVLCALPLFHTFGQGCCMLVAMRTGATLVLVDQDAGDDLVDLFARHQVTIFPAVPYLFESLSDLEHVADLSSLRLCLSGSNFLSPAVRERFEARFGVPIRQTYGSTEAGSVSWDCDPGEFVPESVGRPLNGVTVEILDEDGGAVPRGAVGEIVVSGGAVITEHKRYRTGDLGRIGADGRLHVVGRIRILIDTGGHKVNPVEVEDVLEQHPAVAAAAVVGLPLPGGGELLAAAVIPRAEVTAATLRDHCREHLTAHKMPQRFDFVTEIPRSALGKVRRAELAAVLGGLQRERSLTGQPHEVVVDHLVATVAEVVGLTPGKVDPDTPLRTLGLDSLGALRVRMAIQRDLGRSVGLPRLLGGATITSLVQEGDGTDDTGLLPPVPVGEPTDDFPLSHNQLSLWHDDQLARTDARYNQNFAARLLSDVDVDALRRSFQALVDRHPMLRTNVRMRGGVPRQRVLEQSAVDFAVVEVDSDWDDLSLTEEAFRPFDLETQTPLRVRLFTGPERGPVLLVSVHHLATDYWTFVAMLSDLSAHYTAESSGAELYRPSPAHTYADYVRWLGEVVDGPVGARDLAFWRERLRDLPPAPELPVADLRPAVQHRERATLFQDLTPKSVTALRDLARSRGTTPYTVLLAAFHLLLQSWTGEHDVPVAVITTSRQHDEFRDVHGYFTNPIVSRVPIDADESFDDLVERVRRALLDGIEHQLLPIEVLVKHLDVVRDRSRAPLVEVAFGQNKAHDDDLAPVGRLLSSGPGRRMRLGALELESVALRQRGVSYDYSGAVYESGDAIAIAWEYNTALLSERSVQRMGDAFERLLLAACEASADPVRTLEDPAERDHLLAASRGSAAQEVTRTVDEVIAQRAAVQPDAIAVDSPSGRLTYRELHENADRLASAVHAAPGSRVAILAEHSPELAVAGLALLRAGAVAEPLDWNAELPADIQLVVATPSARERLAGTAVPVVFTDASGERENPGGRLDAQAIVVRTGLGRVVVHGHRALSAHVSAFGERFGDCGDVLVHGALSADQALLRVLAVVAAGGTAVLTPAGAEPEDLAALLGAGRRYDVVMLTPTELALVLPHVGPTADIGVLVVGGEVLPSHLVREWRGRTGCGRVVHEYSTAELFTVSAGDVPLDVGLLVPAGRPVAGVERLVLDAVGRLCPAGVTGEIHVMTPELPRPQPTGDLGRYLDNGDVLVLGERTTIRGYRVDLGQVEAALSRLHAVAHAVVVAHQERLVAHVALTEPAPVAELRDALRRVVPEYMVPADFVVHERFPLGRNGKARRDACPRPTQVETVADDDLSPAEAVLADVWRKVFEVPEVGPHDDYWVDLGGDSVTSLQVVALAAEAGLRVTAKQVFTHPTVRELARVAEVLTDTVVVPGDADRTSLPMTPMQCWFFEQDFADVNHWNLAVLLRPRRPVDSATLRAAVQAVAEHHAAFRLRFSRTPDGWRQELDRQAQAVVITEHDTWSDDLCLKAQRSLDITNGPVLAAVLTPEAVLLVAHHLVIDFVSWQVVIDDLGRACEQLGLMPVATPFPVWTELSPPGSPRTGPPIGSFEERHTRVTSGRLGTAETEALLATPADRESPRPQVIVLAAVVRAVSLWTGCTSIGVDVEGHGRDADADLSRTVGWLTAVRPLQFEFDHSLAPPEVLKNVVEELRREPGTTPAPQATISFNYLGRLGDVLGDDKRGGLFATVPLPSGLDRGPGNRRPYPLEISAMNESGQLLIRVAHGPDRGVDRLVELIIDDLTALVTPEPEPDLATCVRAVWADVLGHDDFTDTDDFFAIGGHSLLIARIMAKLGKVSGLRLPLRLFFDHPTVGGLADVIATRKADVR
ncbi:AMP-binding protein [Lentzea sp. NPDC004782]|uniref:AMP-binding protein n=1 Tax=Lentzea sp. NPDC004782 TaxID=3154458 RepID=UPI0033A758B7